MLRAVERRIVWERREAATLARRLAAAGPGAALGRAQQRLATLCERLGRAVTGRIGEARLSVERAHRDLTTLSPLA